MKNKLIWGVVYALGLLLCVVSACLAVLDRFRFWQTGQRVSMAVILLLAICCIPLWRQIKNGLKAFAENPSAWGFWLVLTVIFWLFDRIAADMLIICYIALPCSLLGAFLMGLANKKWHREDE